MREAAGHDARRPCGDSRPSVALTVDVEDYFHVTAFENEIPQGAWESMPSRIEKNTRRLLDIFSEHGVHGTFFVLGWVADRHPDLIADIARRGHEVASHGYHHQMIHRQTPVQFREDVRKAKRAIEDTLGEPILGYRAPTFSITPRSQWAHAVLAEEGYRYSSSVFPVRHDRYGWPGFGDRPRWVPTGGGSGIWEFPLSSLKIGGTPLPFGGGGYLRIYPLWLTLAMMGRKIRDPECATVMYLHPWEIDPGQPRVGGSALRRLRHYWGLARSESKVRRILGSFRFAPIRESLSRFAPTGAQAG